MLTEIKLDSSVKAEVVTKLQKYFEDELQQEIGSFDAEFLLDFFSKEVGGYYYNQGLTDALKSFESKMEDVGESIYQLERETG
ncbi:MAG: hypothetical protein COB20_03890 [SAR86 cluster bacterium]|uniref:DUF2164 domain-containing protein n=1 Tax=SAR86 cluster bacterium TaxID=2030880 RepID=A0A2A4XBQ7_9GAMM|nr:MAG: hypothetical protein COB20_03890 [SAR86 cluster bacterium]